MPGRGHHPGGIRMSEPTATVRWIDLSPHGLTLHAVRLPSGRAVLVAAGHTTDHGAALAALGFRRTRQGHVVHPEPTLKFLDVRRHFPRATVREMPRAVVVRVVPTVAPPTPSLAPTIAPTYPDHRGDPSCRRRPLHGGPSGA